MMGSLPPAAQEAIRDDLEGTHKYKVHEFADASEPTQETPRHYAADADESPTGRIPLAGDR
jgi:phospholipid/cholesterol/gamma-HCH transport system ATP-binding protein